MRKRDLWLWNPGLVKPVIIVPLVVVLVIVAATYPFMGPRGLLFFLFGLIGPIIGLVYGIVGRKVAVLTERLVDEEGVKAESLIVIGYIQSPGIAILTDSTLRLVPIVGEERTIDRSSMDTVRLVRFFNGKAMLWKKWLVLSVKPRLGFSLPESIAEEWYERLSRKKGDAVFPA